jgi:predicted dehydrogenase
MTEIGEPLKWGIIGLGFISRDFVLALNFCQRPHKVVALAASNSVERSLKFRSEVGLDDSVKAYADYDSLIRDPDVGIWQKFSIGNEARPKF